MSRSEFDKDYKQWLRQLDVGDGDTLWKEIENELDFNETWGNISSHLDVVQPEKSRKIGITTFKVLLAAAAVILLLIIPVNYNNNDIQTDQTIVTSSEMAKMEVPESRNDFEEITDDNLQVLPAEDPNEDYSILQSYPGDIVYLGEERINEEENIIYSLYDEDKLTLDNIPMKEWALNKHFAANLKPMSVNADLKPEDKEIKGRFNNPFHLAEAGLVFGYKNTWLWNSETQNGLNSGSLRNTLPTFHYDIGFTSTIEYKNTHRFGLQLLWKSTTGQNYKQYINASYVERNIQLNYLKLQAFYMWDIKRIPGQFLFGTYFAKLNFAEEDRDGSRVSLGDNYRNSDYGLLLGYQYEVSVRNKFILKPGIRTNTSLVNIFRGDDLTPADMNKTRNFAFGFDLAIYYKFSR